MNFSAEQVACLLVALEKLRRSVLLGSPTLPDSVAAYAEEARARGTLSRTESGIVLRACAKLRRYAFTGREVTVVQVQTRCGSTKADRAAIGPEATPEGASVCRTEARKGHWYTTFIRCTVHSAQPLGGADQFKRISRVRQRPVRKMLFYLPASIAAWNLSRLNCSLSK
jgi:hypothetical protein